MEDQSHPNSRLNKFSLARGKKINYAVYSQDRVAWLNLENLRFVLYVFDSNTIHDNDDLFVKEPGDDVQLNVYSKSKLGLKLRLSYLTEAELKSVKQIFDMAYEAALPVTQLRDQIAKDALNEGDDSHVRIYRGIPKLFVRQRKKSDDSN